MKRQIIAMGGGGFSMEPENPLLDTYILNQVDKETPKLAFIGTASDDSQDYIDRFYKSFSVKNCIPSHLASSLMNAQTLEAFILNQDIIYVGGGNTRKMLQQWQNWGLDIILKKAYDQGIILSGLSAGAMCWFEQGLTDSWPGELRKMDCLGFLSGSYCPHFDGEPKRQEAYKSKIQSSEMKAGIACDDGVGVHFVNEEIHRIISSRPSAAAFKYAMGSDRLIESKLEPIQLNGLRIS